jgi:hypothetical protein
MVIQDMIVHARKAYKDGALTAQAPLHTYPIGTLYGNGCCCAIGSCYPIELRNQFTYYRGSLYTLQRDLGDVILTDYAAASELVSLHDHWHYMQTPETEADFTRYLASFPS